MKKPRVFISSTIYDFKDLRSAIKFYLEENGFEVVTSETSDFPVDNHKNSYQACLDAISTCDYFILFIGSRVGGKYKYQKEGKTETITITRAEYRRAYELFKEDKIKLINFVRKEIYDVREDRKGLEDVLLALDLQENERTLVKEHESRIIKNAGEIFRFLEEVSRNVEMKKANQTESAIYPTGNWIYQFSSFNDIVSVLKNTLNINRGLAKQIWMENIRTEVIENIVCLTQKVSDGRIVKNFQPGLIGTDKLYSAHDFKLSGRDLWKLYYFNTIGLPNVLALKYDVMRRALQSETFFDYDSEEQRLKPNKIYYFLHKLIWKLQRVQHLYAIRDNELRTFLEFYRKYDIKNLYSDLQEYKVNWQLFNCLINLAYCLDDIYFMMEEYLCYYNDDTYLPRESNGVRYNIFKDENEIISNETTNFEEIDNYYRNYIPKH